MWFLAINHLGTERSKHLPVAQFLCKVTIRGITKIMYKHSKYFCCFTQTAPSWTQQHHKYRHRLLCHREGPVHPVHAAHCQAEVPGCKMVVKNCGIGSARHFISFFMLKPEQWHSIPIHWRLCFSCAAGSISFVKIGQKGDECGADSQRRIIMIE